MDNDMLLRIRLQYGNDIERLEKMTSEEMQAIYQSEYHANMYHNISIHFSGNIDTKDIIEKYNIELQKNECLRTNYFYQNQEEPFKAIHAYKESDFMIQAFWDETNEKKKKTIRRAFACALRNEYNPQKDRLLKIKAYIYDTTEMIVFIQFNQYLLPKDKTIQIIKNIFQNLKAYKVEYDNKEHTSLNYPKSKESTCYWENRNSYWPVSMKVPGANPSNHLRKVKGIYENLDNSVVSKINKYCDQHNLPCESVVLYAWAKIFSSFHNEKRPILFVAQDTQTPLEAFPVSINCKENLLVALQQTAEQLSKANEFSELTLADLEEIYQKKFVDYFQLIHHFIDLRFKMSKQLLAVNEESLSSELPLTCHYHIFDDEIGIHYVYHDNVFTEEVIERLHALFKHMLHEVLDQKFSIFDKQDFLKDIKSDEEKRKKIRIAANALYLRKSDLFPIRSANELMKLAELGQVEHYKEDDIIIESSSLVDCFGIIGTGRVEESSTGNDGIQRTLRVMCEGDVLGFECLFMEDYSRHNYITQSSEASILWIEKNILIDFLNQNPDNWRYFIANSQKNVLRLEKLWMME